MLNKNDSTDQQPIFLLRQAKRKLAFKYSSIIVGRYGIACRLICTFVVSSLYLHSHSAQAQSFEDALAMAYAGNPALQAERAKLRSVDESVGVALSDWRPTASIQADAGASHQAFDGVSGDLKPADAALTVTQPIFNGGSTVANTKVAEENVRQERAQLTATEQNVLVGAATAYLDIVQYQEILDLQVKNEESLRDWLSEMNQRFTMGEKTRTDVSQSESRLARARVDRSRAEVNLSNARSTYARYIGQMPGTLTKPTLKEALPPTREDAILTAQSLAPSVQAAIHAARAGEANIDAVRGNLLPVIDIQGSVSGAHNENVPEVGLSENRSQNDQILVQLKIPFYTGGGDYARLRAAYQDRSQQRRNKDEAVREAEETVTQAWDQMQTTAANMASLQTQIVSAQAALDGMKQEERVGDRTSTDTLNAEQELLDSKIAAVQAEHDHMVASIQLLAAVGDFTAQKLNLKVDIYNPEKHYVENRNRLAGIGEANEK